MRNEVSAVEFELFNKAADNNRQVIHDQLERLLSPGQAVLEIGSGSGQHVVHFAANLPEIDFFPTDKEPYFDSLCRNLDTVSLKNIEAPHYLDVASFEFDGMVDVVYCANVIHIMAEALLASLVAGAAGVLRPGGLLVNYGPFKYGGEFTTESNAKFDQWLKSRDQLSGIRDFERVQSEAVNNQLVLLEDNAMPANNQLLVFRKEPVL